MSKPVVLSILTAAALATGATPAHAASGKGVAKSVKKSISAVTGARVTKMTCPSVMDNRKGKKQTCKATFATGDKSPITVRWNSSSNYTATLINFLTQQLEGQLIENFGAATATCPKTVKIKKGDTFECQATDAQGNSAVIDITQTGRGKANAKVRQ